jgi:polysaccharide deacetylase family protein (PEP-CTERM system associated)
MRVAQVTAGTQLHRTVTTHFFTVDVEEHFQVSAFEGVVRREAWPRLESRVGRNIDILLEILARYGVKGTFFTLGWIAEHRPEVVRAIAGAGHEVASHGYGHQRVTGLTPAEFREDVRRAKRVLEDVAAMEVLGYRAPSFSIVPGWEWAFDVLIEEGYRYDSSLFPVRRSRFYGYPGAPTVPHWINRPSGRLLELPMAVLRRLGQNIPAAGGAYLRILPYWVTSQALSELGRRGVPGMFYLHPWELDPEQPRVNAPLAARLRHYTGLRRAEPRLERLLGAFPFTAVADQLDLLPVGAAA